MELVELVMGREQDTGDADAARFNGTFPILREAKSCVLSCSIATRVILVNDQSVNQSETPKTVKLQPVHNSNQK